MVGPSKLVKKNLNNALKQITKQIIQLLFPTAGNTRHCIQTAVSTINFKTYIYISGMGHSAPILDFILEQPK